MASRPAVPVAVAAALDALSVLVFVALGRNNHDEGTALSGTLEVAAPFLIALAAGWILLRVWRRPADLVSGVGVWAFTLVLGMVLRNVVFDRGTATSFVLVASAFLALFLVGWRAVAALVLRRRAATAR